MKNKMFYWLLATLVLLSTAFAPRQDEPQSPVFQDPINYLTNSLLTHSFSAWKDGAQATISLEKDFRSPGDPAMRVDLLGPNPRTANRDASVFRILQLLERGWGGASAARLWVKNPAEFPLILSFNFKEEFNEYWATSGSQVFFLEEESGNLLKQNAQYGNLPIPAGYEGYLVIPFAGMTVPEWNTAHGDARMDLTAVESFAIGISVDQHYPRSFYVDDFSVIAGSFPYIEISGAPEIDIPSSGERREPFSAALFSPEGQMLDAVEPEWSLAAGSDEALRLDDGGWLIIPAGLKSQKATLAATYLSGGRVLKAEWTVNLLGQAPSGMAPQPQSEDLPQAPDPALRDKSPYEQFSEDFETWAYTNRTLFVVLAVGAIIVMLVVLSYFQRRLR